MGLYVKIKKDFGSFLLDTEFEAQEEVLGILERVSRFVASQEC